MHRRYCWVCVLAGTLAALAILTVLSEPAYTTATALVWLGDRKHGKVTEDVNALIHA